MQSHVVYHLKCLDCGCDYFGLVGIVLSTHIQIKWVFGYAKGTIFTYLNFFFTSSKTKSIFKSFNQY
jgi:hypothetical protein